MNKSQIEGRIEQAEGNPKTVTGAAVGDKSLEAKGRAEQVVGKVKVVYGDFKAKLEDHIRKR